MKALVQWTKRQPENWVEVDAARFADLVALKRPEPTERSIVDDDPGWCFAVSVQGVEFSGADHYHVAPLSGGGLRVTAWGDDPDDWPVGDRWAVVHDFWPLAPDARFGGAINTRQRRRVYADPRRLEHMRTNAKTDEFFAWDDFQPPDKAECLHGIWISDELAFAHRAARSRIGWRDARWCEHLDAGEKGDDGSLPVQRDRGRYPKSRFTITWICRDTDRANGALTANHEDALEDATATAGTESVTLATGTVDQSCWVFSTASGAPGVADWPSGDYRVQYDVTVLEAAGGGTASLTETIFHRMSSDLSSSLAQIGSDTTNFTTTGLHIHSITVDPAAGNDTDRFATQLLCDNTASHGGGNGITLELNTTDSFADGPWVGTQSFSYTASGGMVFAGAADIAITKDYVASGGVILAGAADLAITKDYTPSGGAVFAGAADTSYVQATQTFTYEASGGAVFAGAADIAITKDYVASGGAVFGGAADLAITKDYVASGGAVLGGAADLAITKDYDPSGGMALAGVADLAITKDYVPSGGMVLAGAADLAITKDYVASGGALFAGQADIAVTKDYVASGGVLFGGAADTNQGGSQTFTYEASGGLNTGGVAGLQVTKNYTPSGGIVVAGAADLARTHAVSPDGGIAFSGVAGLMVTKVYTPAGGLLWGGTASTVAPSGETTKPPAPIIMMPAKYKAPGKRSPGLGGGS